jgi:nucleoside-diphosphate-sugar epimerase
MPLVLTGGTGFLGRRLVAALAAAGAPPGILLSRRPGPPAPAGWRWAAADLARPGPWAAALEGADTVAHLAALTGKGSRRAHFRANRDTTRHLLDAARAAGVRRFLFVSSVAAGYADRRHYHYANAKAEAEALVRDSGLQTLVVRPTMILGPGSPVLANLSRLATLPVPVAFGPPDQPVQPVHVDDVARALVALLAAPAWDGRVVEVGGPEVVPAGELAARIRAARGLPARRPLRLPVEPLRTVLAVLEPLALPLLPFTAGQLAAFTNPGVAAPRPPGLDLPAPVVGLDAMLVP